VLTLHQALEQIESATLGLPRMAAILLQLRLDCGKYLGLDKCGDRDGEPVFWGHIHGRDGASGLECASPLGTEPRAQRFLTCFAKRCRANIRRIF
jgi:hypothetical protein